MKKLGEGSFGSVYSAKENDNLYAIKFENKNKGQNLLEKEAYIMSYLNGPRIPTVKSFGYSGDNNVLIMELMGKSLEDLFENSMNKKMSIRCVCNLGYQMIEIMEYIHNKHIIHRDIKPDNFVMGRDAKKKTIIFVRFWSV
jgi:serine/threonine protein kinase